jgi:hypothetical protein
MRRFVVGGLAAAALAFALVGVTPATAQADCGNRARAGYRWAGYHGRYAGHWNRGHRGWYGHRANYGWRGHHARWRGNWHGSRYTWRGHRWAHHHGGRYVHHHRHYHH